MAFTPLTDEQHWNFDTDGFLVVSGVSGMKERLNQ